MAALVVAALALGACGRKGPLQLPPEPQAQAGPASSTAAVEEEGVIGPTPNPVYEASPDEAPAAAKKGRKKTFILDPLLNSN